MAKAAIDLRTLLQQDLEMIRSLLDVSQKLVLEIKTTHYWTTLSLDTFGSLRNIGLNIEALLNSVDGDWQGKKDSEEARKLWKTAVGLWRAMPPVRNKFTENLNRRRRQRIMGDELEEEEIDKAEWDLELSTFKEQHTYLKGQFDKLAGMVNQIPEGIVFEGQPEKAPAEQKQDEPDDKPMESREES